MLYINYKKEGHVIYVVGFAVNDTEQNRKILEKDIKKKRVVMPKDFDDYSLNNKSLMT